jgi:molybdate/tungstate transport system permease protein
MARPPRDRPLIVFSVLGALLLLFIVIPIAGLLATADPARVLTAAGDREVRDALATTLGAALVATGVALLLGAPLGYVLARERFFGKAVVEGIVDMPVVIPHTIAGIALLFVFGRSGLVGEPIGRAFGVAFTDSFWGVVVAMLFVGMPFVVNHARAAFLEVDPRLEYVARSLGASYLGAIARVTLPLTWRALLSGAILTWARAISEFGSIAVIAYYPKTINTLLFEWYNFHGYPYAQPLAALLLLIALALFVVLRAVARPKRA